MFAFLIIFICISFDVNVIIKVSSFKLLHLQNSVQKGILNTCAIARFLGIRAMLNFIFCNDSYSCSRMNVNISTGRTRTMSDSP
jgi:hypothetical protein